MQGLDVALRQVGPIPLDTRFACAPGETLALLGPSGGGKSTVLRAIAGIYRVAEGRIEVGGEAWFDSAARRMVPPHARRAGVVFQSYALFPHMTALDNVAAAMSHLPHGNRRERAGELLELVHLAGLEDRRPAELSGGQQQRVAVARALARDPEVLLLDEPFSAVDKATRERLYRELAMIRQQLSMPVVLVTHDLDEAMMLADTLCLLHHGRSLQQGPPAAVVERPLSVTAARLVGQRNVFDAEMGSPHPDSGCPRLRWRGRLLEVADSGGRAEGEPVAWMIPAAKVLLHRRERPSRGEAENPVAGVIGEHVVLGEETINVLHVDGDAGLGLTFRVPRHVAERNGLAVGVHARVSLLAAAIHLMPPG